MLDKLREALAECVAEKTAAESVSYENEIAEKVAEYEAKIRAEYNDKKNADVLDVSYQIRAIEKLIAKEEARLVAEAEAAAVGTDTDNVAVDTTAAFPNG